MKSLILKMSRSLSINLYSRPFSIAIHGKLDWHCLHLLFRLFWPINYASLVCKLCLLFQTILDLWSLLTLEVFSSEIIKRISFNFSLLCKHWLSWFVTCTNQVCISWHIWNIANVLFEGFFNLVFLVYSVYKDLKSNQHLLFLAVFPNM